MVQTRWSYINRNYSTLTEVEAILLDGHFAIEHSSRFRSGLFFNFNGTAGIWRRNAIEDAGGWQHDTLTEDTDLSYRAQMRGWQFLYLPEIDCPSELPVEMNAFKSQQARWAKGLMQTAKKILPQVFRSNAPAKVKAEAVFHLTANISYPLMVFLSIILLPAMIVRFYQGWFQVLLIDLPLFHGIDLLDFVFLFVCAERVLPENVETHILYLPFVMAVGIGLSVRNAVAVMEAICGVRSEFVRTPKYRVEAAGKAPLTWRKRNTRAPAGCRGWKWRLEFTSPAPWPTASRTPTTSRFPSCFFSSGVTSIRARCLWHRPTWFAGVRARKYCLRQLRSQWPRKRQLRPIFRHRLVLQSCGLPELSGRQFKYPQRQCRPAD